MPHTAVDLFTTRRAQNKATVLIFYRGERSFFCRQWLRRWFTIPAIDRRLDLADVVLVFTSSQSQGKAFSMAEQIAAHHPLLDSRIFFFGDPEHLLVNALPEHTAARPVITNPDSHRAHGWVFDYGMVQPAVIAVAADSSIIYDWTTKPTLLNVAGKLDRPDPWEIWDRIERRLDRIRIANARIARQVAHIPTTSHALSSSHSPSSSLAPPDSATSPAVAPDPLHLTPTHQTTRTETPYCSDPACAAAHHVQTHRHHAIVDANSAPLSTAVDTLLPSHCHRALHEHMDISQTNLIANIHVHDLSARINALAKDLLAEQPPAHHPTSDIDLTAPTHHPLLRNSLQIDSKPLSNLIESTSSVPEDVEPTSTSLSPAEADISDRDDSEHCTIHPNRNDSLDPSPLRSESRPDLSQPTSAALTEMPDDHDATELEPLYADDVQSESLRPLRRFDLFERQSLSTEPLETSVASGGSDQIDSTTVITKHASIRTDDSSQLNSVQYDVTSFSSDRRIQEEADDRETGISDYLKELKDPTLLAEMNFRMRADSSNRAKAAQYAKNNTERHHAVNEPQTLIIEKGALADPATGKARLSKKKPSKPPPSLVVESSVEHSSKYPNGLDSELALSTNLLESTMPLNRQTRNFSKPAAVDSSPFVDADNDIEVPDDAIAKSELRDEYEAYDEYIVCEYEVEEHVEEYESDAISKSRGFMTTLFSDGRAPMRPSSVKNMYKEGNNLRQDGGASGARNPRDVRALKPAEAERTKSGNVLAAMASAPSLNPVVDAKVLEWPEGRRRGGKRSRVRRVLRRIKVPRFSGRRRGGGRGNVAANDADEDGTSHLVAMTSDGDVESSRIRRKDTFRSALRKRGTMSASPTMVRLDGTNSKADAETVDELSSKVGRKETLKAVLKKIPVPKNRRRASTGEAAAVQPALHTLTGKAKGDEELKQREVSELMTKLNAEQNKGKPFQAVLQRLPSLSGPSREHRSSLSPHFSFFEQGRKSMDGLHTGGTNEGDVRSHFKSGIDVDAALDEDEKGTAVRVGLRAELKKQPPRVTSDVGGPESPKLRNDKLLHSRLYDGDVSVAGLSNTGADTSGHGESKRKQDGGGLQFRRSFSRLTTGETSLTEDGTDEMVVVRDENEIEASMSRMNHRAGSVAVADVEGSVVQSDRGETCGIGVDGRRRRRRRKRVDAAGSSETEGPEKIGPKISFASVGERILSRFKIL